MGMGIPIPMHTSTRYVDRVRVRVREAAVPAAACGGASEARDAAVGMQTSSDDGGQREGAGVDHVTDDARQSLPLTVAATTTRRNAAASSAAEGDERKAPVVDVRSSSTVERTAGHE